MQKEKLSLFIDGKTEQIDEKFVTELASEQSLQECWHRYHLIGAAIRDELNDNTLQLDIVDRIEQALAAEPVLLKPQVSISQGVISPKKTASKRHRVWPFISQVSIAAGIAFVTIIGVQQYSGSESGNSSPVFNTVPVAMNVSPVGYHPEQDNRMDTMFQKDQLDRVKQMLNNYELQRRIHN